MDIVPAKNEEGLVYFAPPEGMAKWSHASRWGIREWTAWLSQKGWSEDRIKEYVWHDRYQYGLGFKRDQKDPFKWFYLPTPRGVEMHKCRKPNVGFGGAAGGSKSHGSRHDAYRHCLAIKGFRAIIMRRTFNELKRNHMDKARGECRLINEFLGKTLLEFVPSEHEIRFANGSLILFGHCQNPGDEDKYLSDEYDAFYPDEVATFLQEQVMAVAGRLRSPIEGIEPRMVATTNPSGAQTLWFRQWFVDHEVDLTEYPDYDPNDFHFIQSLLYDNPYLMDSDGTYRKYIKKRLGMLKPIRRRQMIEGDWSAISGQYFEEWSAPIRFVEKPWSELRNCRFERWMDWGYTNPGVMYWVAIAPEGHIHIFREYKFQKTIPSIVATAIKKETDSVLKLIAGAHRRISKSIGDPAMFGIDGGTGETYAETFRRHGVKLEAGDNQRVLGWGRFASWLALDPNGRPWLTVDPRACPYAKRTVAALVHDKTNPEDIDTSGEDHAGDAIRYGLMGRPEPDPANIHRIEVLTDSVRAMLNSLATPTDQYAVIR